MFTDTHCHAFDERIDFKSVDLSNVKQMLVCSYCMENLQTVLDFCLKNAKCFCALGVHPQYVNNFNLQKFLEIFTKNREKIAAIGEIGLDCTYQTDYEMQKNVFIRQMEIAQKFDLPVSVHLRTKTDFENFFKIKEQFKNVKCALHCFLGDEQDLSKALELNRWFSFAANITYRRNVKLREMIHKIPINKILIETDSPSMLPASFGKRGINTPQNIGLVAQKIAQILQLSVEQIESITNKNAEQIFNFKRIKNGAI